MAHFAQVDENGIVLQVLVVADENTENAQEFLAETLGLGGTWIQTSYNTSRGIHKDGGTPLRKNYAGIGYTYDFERDAFIPPKPYESWLLNEDSCIWEAPIPYPSDGEIYTWDEESTSWVIAVPPLNEDEVIAPVDGE